MEDPSVPEEEEEVCLCGETVPGGIKQRDLKKYFNYLQRKIKENDNFSMMQIKMTFSYLAADHWTGGTSGV